MRSPFSDFTATNPEKYVSASSALQFESPLLDPVQIESKKEYEEPETFSYESLVKEESETTNIDIETAIRLNKKYEAELWGSQKTFILKYFSSIGITKDAAPLDGKQFSLAVAKWQSTVFQNKKSADGVLGPNSWNVLKTRINLVSKPVSTTAPAPVLSRWHEHIKGTTLSAAEPLVYGKETFAAIVKAIRTASKKGHYIYILGWMLDVNFPLLPNDPSTKLSELLKTAAAAEVEIRILIWGDNPYYQNTLSIAERSLNTLGKDNLLLIKDKVTYGSPILALALQKIREKISAVPLPFRKVLEDVDMWNDLNKYTSVTNEGSHHEKVIIVKGDDGLVGFCGGIDINPDRIGGFEVNGNPMPIKGFDEKGIPQRAIPGFRNTLEILHDVHCQLKGYGAYSLLQRFLWRWDQAFRGNSDQRMNRTMTGRAEKPPAPAPPGKGISNVKILSTYNQKNGNIIDRSIFNTVETAIKNAKKSVHLECQYMISVEIASLLHSKLMTIKDFTVSILTQDDKFAGDDIPIIKKMRREFRNALYGPLSRNDPRISIWSLDPATRFPAHHKVHSKIYIVDKELVIIGSANCSRRSMTHDSETGVVIFNDGGTKNEFVESLEKKYDRISNWIKYEPNPEVKDIDIRIVEKVDDYMNSLSLGSVLLNTSPGGQSIRIAVRVLAPSLPPILQPIVDPYDNRVLVEQEFIDFTKDNGEFTGEQIYYEAEEANETETEAALSNSENDNEMDQYENTPDYEKEMNAVTSDPEQINYEEAFLDNTNFENRENINAFMPGDNEIAAIMKNQVAVAKASDQNTKPCEGRTCWAKLVLNRDFKLALSLNNILDDQTKKAIGDFQAKNNLTSTKIIDTVTERALLEADALHRNKGTALQPATEKTIGEAKTKIEDWTKPALNNKPQHILNSYRDPRKVYAFVLHHMAFKRKSRKTGLYSDPNSYLSTGAHFCIMLDGRIIQLHAMTRMIWHGNCISPGSVAVEFEGNFPNVKGSWWYPTDEKTGKKIKINEDKPTQAQFDSGRFLTGYLKFVLGTTHILAHRQSSDSRENDPGPDIWYNVGQWAVEKLGLSDGGPNFKCGTGNPILPQWRTWGNKTVPAKNSEYQEMTEEGYVQAEDSAYNQDAIENTEWGENGNMENETRSYSHISAGAANIFLTLTGQRQGQIKGSVVQKGKEGSIAVYQVHHEITSPRDAASGQATGKRIHKPLVIIKEIDVASAKLLNALVTNEMLKEVMINFWKPGSKGLEVNYYRITLTNAVIANISQDLPDMLNRPETKFSGLEKVEFVYQKIEWSYLADTKSFASDDTTRALNESELHEAEQAEENKMGIAEQWDEQEFKDPDSEQETAVDNEEFNYETDIVNEAPEFENFSLAYKLSKLNDWAYLLKFKVPDAIVLKLKARNMSVQYAHNESYSNDLNVDFYRLRIDKFPTLNGVTLNAQSLIRYIRLNINSLVDTSYCDWQPYDVSIDASTWNSDDSTGAVMRQNIKGPDNASVLVGLSKPTGWRFTTVTTPKTGRHPVSGHREFFIGKDSATGRTYFIIKGLDMMSTGIAGLGLPLAGRWGFAQGDALWKSMREKVIKFINSNGGVAKTDITYSERVEWRYVYHSYKNLLADTFGKGAGSAENSSFFSFQLAE